MIIQITVITRTSQYYDSGIEKMLHSNNKELTLFDFADKKIINFSTLLRN